MLRVSAPASDSKHFGKFAAGRIACMVVTIQQALVAGNATPDDVAVILDRLGTDGYAGEKAAGSAFLLLKPEDYEETLNPYQRNLIRAAQLAQGGGAGVPLGCMFVAGQVHEGDSCPWSWTGGLLLVLLQRAGQRDSRQQMPSPPW